LNDSPITDQPLQIYRPVKIRQTALSIHTSISLEIIYLPCTDVTGTVVNTRVQVVLRNNMLT